MGLKIEQGKMIKTLFAVALALIAVGASASENIRIKYELTKDGDVISSASSVVQEGFTLPFTQGRERGYLKSATHSGPNIALTPGTVTTGFTMTVKPKVTSEGKILLVLKAEQADLLSMDKAKSGDLEIEVPRVRRFKISEQRDVNSGEQVEFPFVNGQKDSGYVLLVTATKTE